MCASRDQQTVGAFDAVLGGKVAVYDIVTLDRELVVGVGFLRDVLLGRDQVDRVLEQRSKDVVIRSKLFADRIDGSVGEEDEQDEVASCGRREVELSRSVCRMRCHSHARFEYLESTVVPM